MADRTLFFGLPLAGVETIFVESLRGYMLRLAYLHSLTPMGFLETLRENFPLKDVSFQARMFHRWQMHGGSGPGAQVLANLQSATNMSLAASSMRRFRSVLTGTFLVHPRVGRYCPVCVRQEHDPEKKIAPLLWEVQCVECCPEHKVLLRDRMICGASLSDRLVLSQRPQLPGTCTQCGSIGFECIADEPVAASNVQVWVAQSVGRLLALTDARSQALSTLTMRAGLQDLVDRCYGGSVVRAAKDVGMGKPRVYEWINTNTQISLRSLMELCHRTGADAASLLEGRYASAPSTKEVVKLAPRKYTKGASSWAEVERALKIAVTQEHPPTKEQLAQTLGVNLRAMRDRVRGASDHLALVGRIYRTQLREQKFDELVARFTSVAFSIVAEGKSLNRKNLTQRTGIPAISKKGQGQRAINVVIQRFSAQRADGVMTEKMSADREQALDTP